MNGHGRSPVVPVVGGLGAVAFAAHVVGFADPMVAAPRGAGPLATHMDTRLKTHAEATLGNPFAKHPRRHPNGHGTTRNGLRTRERQEKMAPLRDFINDIGWWLLGMRDGVLGQRFKPGAAAAWQSMRPSAVPPEPSPAIVAIVAIVAIGGTGYAPTAMAPLLFLLAP